MGVDKARVAWNGMPLALVVRRNMLAVCGRVALVRREPFDDLPWIDEDGAEVEVIAERGDREPHPLWGVETALSAARTDLVLIAPCDVPYLTSKSFARLAAAGPCVAVGGRRLHSLVAALDRREAKTARELAERWHPAVDLISGLPRVKIRPRELRNVNEPGAVPGPGPVAALLSRVSWATDDERRRIAEGEIARLAAWGMIDPHAPRTG
jgi:molybdopterin-guanine dinucleotide biosynthesis protein A